MTVTIGVWTQTTIRRKIRGDLDHLLRGYAGMVNMFDIITKYVVGDVVIRRSEDPYTYENFIDESAHSVKRFNALLCEEDYLFEVLITKHQRRNSELYHIDINGIPREIITTKPSEVVPDHTCSGDMKNPVSLSDRTQE